MPNRIESKMPQKNSSHRTICHHRHRQYPSIVVLVLVLVLVLCLLPHASTFAPPASFKTIVTSIHQRYKGIDTHRSDLRQGVAVVGRPKRRHDGKLLASKYDQNQNDPVDDATAKLLEQAAKLRQEIAEMEGKTVEQVKLEAKQKKDAEARAKAEAASSSSKSKSRTSMQRGMVQAPVTADDMVRQAARSVERAFKAGIVRQTVRFHLVDVNAEETVRESNQWPGGAQQMYRSAGKPLTESLLREMRLYEGQNYRAPILKSQDIWDFDGSALHTLESNRTAKEDVQALVFPNTDIKYTRDIETISNQLGFERLFLLVNPFWRNLDSWGFNLLSPDAKKEAYRVLFNESNPKQASYPETYVCLNFSARGEDCLAIKAYPYDWEFFAYIEDPQTGFETAMRLGTSKEEPTTVAITELINKQPEFKQTKTMRQMKGMM